MTILSAQSIRKHCDVFTYEMVPIHTEIESPWEPSPTPPPKSNWPDWKPERGFILTRMLGSEDNKLPLVDPFVERGVIRGKSFGLSACTYDCRINHDLTLEPIPILLLVELIKNLPSLAWDEIIKATSQIKNAKFRSLAVTMERFCFPNHICGSVLDKSSFARVFVSAFNTHLDPGWQGWLTVELVNLGEETVHYQKGDPVCQVKFEFLDFPTELPYQGKYQNQTQIPTPAIKEE